MKDQEGNKEYCMERIILSRFGSIYTNVKNNFYWKVYYQVLGVPFLSAHLVYFLLKKFGDFKKTDRVLDYGTGDGVFLNQLTIDFNLTGIGIDRLKNRIIKATWVSEKNKLGNNFITSDFSKINLAEKFDKVLCLDILEHVDNLENAIAQISAFLKKGGQVFIQAPRGGDKKIFIKKEVFTYGDDEHKRSGIDLEQIRKILQKNKLEISYWQSDFCFVSQLIYEILETFRLRNKFIYSILWPVFYPICILDFLVNKRRNSNGLFIIAVKNQK